MPHPLDRENILRLKLGDRLVRVLHRLPTPAETIEALIRKAPRGDEIRDAERILLTNLDLGRACITGLDFEGKTRSPDPEAEDVDEGWREQVAERYPLLLIALGQHLSRLPEYVEEDGLKKS